MRERNKNANAGRSSYDDGMARSEKNDYRNAGPTYGSRGEQYDTSSSYRGSDYDYNRAGYRGDSSGFSGQNRNPYGGQQDNHANNEPTQYPTRRALEDREIGVRDSSSSFRDSGSGFTTKEAIWPQPGQHSGKGPKGFRRSDDRILESICEALERNPDIDASEIEVEVNEGIVTLSGTVESRQIKRMSEDLVESLPGVVDIKNDLRIVQNSEATRSKMMSPFDSTKPDSSFNN